MSAPAGDAMPEATRIIAVRHGETAWNADSRMQGQLDIPLNALGRLQAQRLARALADEPLDAIYASDLSRAFDTAQAVAALTGQRVIADTALRERAFGVFQGLTYTEIEQRWPEQGARWRARDVDFVPEGGESLRQLSVRSVEAAARLAAAHAGGTILLVAHGGVMDCLYRAAVRIELDLIRTWQLGNASINRLLYSAEGFSLVGWSDTRHLEDAVLDEAST